MEEDNGDEKQVEAIYLTVHIGEGRAFVGQLADDLTVAHNSKFTLHMQFNGQRACTRPVPASVEPEFGGTFSFKLCDHVPRRASEWAELLEKHLPLYICLTSHRTRQPAVATGAVGDTEAHQQEMAFFRSELEATGVADWRHALMEDGLLSVEMRAASMSSILAPSITAGDPAMGLLQLRLEAVAAPGSIEAPLSAGDVHRIIALRGERYGQATRDFYLAARTWWAQYTNISPLHRNRPITIFAEDERGQQRCVTTFVQPARPARWLDSPRHAARFVSLLPFERAVDIGGRRSEIWHSPHSFLARGRGDVEDHVALLASLLLGYGLDAYVCIGTAEQEDEAGGGNGLFSDHLWVATLTGSGSTQAVYFWESLTGQRYRLGAGQRTTSGNAGRAGRGGPAPVVRAVAPHHFRSVTCMFNHQAFYANKQDEDRVSRTLFDLSNPRLWKRMDPPMLARLPPDNTEVVLLPPAVDPVRCAEAIEAELRELVEVYRTEQGLTTLWDEDLAYLLQPALAAYETERIMGTSMGGDDLDDAVQRAVPNGAVFKAAPMCFGAPQPQRIFTTLAQGPVSSDILQAIGDNVRIVLRARVFAYADRVAAVWIMLACRYQPYPSF